MLDPKAVIDEFRDDRAWKDRMKFWVQEQGETCCIHLREYCSICSLCWELACRYCRLVGRPTTAGGALDNLWNPRVGSWLKFSLMEKSLTLRADCHYQWRDKGDPEIRYYLYGRPEAYCIYLCAKVSWVATCASAQISRRLGWNNDHLMQHEIQIRLSSPSWPSWHAPNSSASPFTRRKLKS